MSIDASRTRTARRGGSATPIDFATIGHHAPAASRFRHARHRAHALALRGRGARRHSSRAAATRGDAPARAIALTECRLPRARHRRAMRRAGSAGESRARRRDARSALAVAVLPANTLTPRPDPLFILAGGPGQAATRSGRSPRSSIDVRRDRDIVLVDQRGTGRSSPLDCAAFGPTTASRRRSRSIRCRRRRHAPGNCRRSGIDPAQYTTAAFVADLDAIRVALGYDRINLWGGSYGTRVALEYLRRHPAQVRSMVLDGVVPPRMAPLARRLADARGRARGADRRLRRRARVPRRASRSRRDARRHRRPPRTDRSRRHAHRSAHRRGTRRCGSSFDHVLAALQPLFYVPELASLLPEVIGRAAAGDFGPLVAAVSLLTADVAEQLNTALHFSVTCADDARAGHARPTRQTPRRRAHAARSRERAARGLRRLAARHGAGRCRPRR